MWMVKVIILSLLVLYFRVTTSNIYVLESESNKAANIYICI